MKSLYRRASAEELELKNLNRRLADGSVKSTLLLNHPVAVALLAFNLLRTQSSFSFQAESFFADQTVALTCFLFAARNLGGYFATLRILATQIQVRKRIAGLSGGCNANFASGSHQRLVALDSCQRTKAD